IFSLLNKYEQENWFREQENWFTEQENWFREQENWFSKQENWFSEQENWFSKQENWFSEQENWFREQENWFSEQENWFREQENWFRELFRLQLLLFCLVTLWPLNVLKIKNRKQSYKFSVKCINPMSKKGLSLRRLFKRNGQNHQWIDDPNSDRKVFQLENRVGRNRNRFGRNRNPAVTRVHLSGRMRPFVLDPAAPHQDSAERSRPGLGCVFVAQHANKRRTATLPAFIQQSVGG
uniref:Uncharacterized protein n=1 Tax=Xiphophorus couchianus TaxID=32473 RepID=A0A3B5MNQ7_9TELE